MTNATTQTEYKAVDISIAGTPHRVVCPANEVKNLEQAAEYINQKIRDLRREIKNKTPTNEEFLVLACLDLYDQVQNLQNKINQSQSEQQNALALIDKINKDAQSVL